MEEGKATQSNNGLSDGYRIYQADCDRIKGVLRKIESDGRIIANGYSFEIIDELNIDGF